MDPEVTNYCEKPFEINHSYLKSDFLTLNYYASDTAKACPEVADEQWSGVNVSGIKGEISGFETHPGFYEMCENPALETTDWAIDPTGLEYILRDIYTRYNMHLMITENGLGAYDELTIDGRIHDDYRIDYLKKHILAVKKAIDFGVKVISYNPWSAIDLLFTSNGYKKRYGLIYIDRTDDDIKQLKRYKKDSFYWYKKVVESNRKEI
ncbi:family 1 glycosylhydrolase [Paenibacillus polymyxa]|uniref:family 1 glycosylhydrolase n=1 Tax=Paenibacillus polymyxa TaxID=1406 RepID=UPI00298D0082|nr:family 1 glycosylhydrolase [Paenibacillus polymyxa]